MEVNKINNISLKCHIYTFIYIQMIYCFVKTSICIIKEHALLKEHVSGYTLQK